MKTVFASEHGFLPENGGDENRAALQRMLDIGGRVVIDGKGEYKLRGGVLIGSDTELVFSAGTSLVRVPSDGGDGAAILPEFKFDAKTPPMCMVHGDKDFYSPMASVQLYTELHKRKIPAQLFVYANVSHGLGDKVNVAGWQRRVVDWIESIGF